MGGSRRTRALLLGLLACWALTPAEAGAQVSRPEIASVRFDGNESFPDDSLARAIATRATECRSLIFQVTLFCSAGADFAIQRRFLGRRDVAQDRIRLLFYYNERGFREATVDTAVTMTDEGMARVAFFVHEGTPILVRSIAIEGVEGMDDAIVENLPLEPGDRLSDVLMGATRDTLVSRLANRGYAYADVLLRNVQPNDDAYRADVTFDVEPGPLSRYGPIEILGNDRLGANTIRNTIQLREGDLYRRAQLFDAQARLFGLDIIRNATVTAVPGGDDMELDSVIPLQVNVAEGDAYRLRYGAGLTTAECFDAEARWTARNFLGGGRVLQVRGRLANIFASQFRDILCPQAGRNEFGKLNWLATVDFVQPWIFSSRNSFSASVFGERQSVPDIFVREAIGLELALRRVLSAGTSVTTTYRPEFSSLEAAEILFCSGFLVCSPGDIDVLQGTNLIAPVGLNFTRNLSNNVLNPTRGYSIVADVEHASRLTGSDFRYDRLTAEAAWYDGLGTEVVVATRVRGGWVGAGAFSELTGADGADVVHPQKRFYAGGANSVRGYAQSRLGPGVLQVVDPVRLLLSTANSGAGCAPEELIDQSCDASALEDRYYIPRPTGGTRVLEANLELRFDVGRSIELVAFTDAGQVWGGEERVGLGDMQVTPGLGLRYLSPIGPLRLDVGYKTRAGQTVSVVTRQIRPFDPDRDIDEDLLQVGTAKIPYVRAETLAILTPQVEYGVFRGFSPSRLQIHISIGQAF